MYATPHVSGSNIRRVFRFLSAYKRRIISSLVLAYASDVTILTSVMQPPDSLAPVYITRVSGRQIRTVVRMGPMAYVQDRKVRAILD